MPYVPIYSSAEDKPRSWRVGGVSLWRLVHWQRYLAKDILNHVAGDSLFLLFGCGGLDELDSHIILFGREDTGG